MATVRQVDCFDWIGRCAMGTAEDAIKRFARMMVLADAIRALVHSNTETSRAQVRTLCTELLNLLNAEDTYYQSTPMQRIYSAFDNRIPPP